MKDISEKVKKIAIVGAGAAGCFCAVELKRRVPSASLELFEAKNRALAKVAVTGGGRCNLTNTFRQVRDLRAIYPRGDKLMKRVLSRFSHRDTWEWWEREGVRLVAQEDECVFPVSQDAMEIVHTLLRRLEELHVPIHLGHKVQRIESHESGYELSFAAQQPRCFDVVVFCTGGSPKAEGLQMLEPLGLDIQPPLPSLFTLCTEGTWMQDLMGTVVEHASVALAGTKLRAEGPLLVTHWGLSGPAVLKLTSYAARSLAETGYRGQIVVDWMGNTSQEEASALLCDMASRCSDKYVGNEYPRELTCRLWRHLLQRAGIQPDTKWKELGRKALNRLTNALAADCYQIEGKYPHREEFVTCGGVALGNIDPRTMECKKHPGLYFAGEVLDVDAVTGGFNLQAAWSMGWLVAESVSASCQKEEGNRSMREGSALPG